MSYERWGREPVSLNETSTSVDPSTCKRKMKKMQWTLAWSSGVYEAEYLERLEIMDLTLKPENGSNS